MPTGGPGPGPPALNSLCLQVRPTAAAYAALAAHLRDRGRQGAGGRRAGADAPVAGPGPAEGLADAVRVPPATPAELEGGHAHLGDQRRPGVAASVAAEAAVARTWAGWWRRAAAAAGGGELRASRADATRAAAAHAVAQFASLRVSV